MAKETRTDCGKCKESYINRKNEALKDGQSELLITWSYGLTDLCGKSEEESFGGLG